MKRIAVILQIFLFPITLVAQLTIADSLKAALLASRNDTDRMEILKQLSWEYAWSYPDSSLKYSSVALKLAEQSSSPEKRVDILTAMGQALAGKGNLSEALTADFKALELAEKTRNEDLIAWAFGNIGATYFYAEDYSNALQYFIKIKSYPDGFAARKRLYLGLIGEAFYHLNSFDSAMHYIRQSYELGKITGFHWSVPYLYMGKLSEKNKAFLEALHFYRAGLEKPVPQTDSVKVYVAIANVFKQTQMPDSGLHYAKLAFSLTQNSSLPLYTVQASSLIKDFYKLKNQTDSAFKYQEIMVAVKDSVFNRDKLNQLQMLTFDEQRRQQEIIKEKEEWRTKIKMYSLVAGLAVFLIIVLLLIRSNRFKQRANTLLQKQKTEIDIQKSKAENALKELKATQSQLIQSEKMASLGELTAGIAHEIQNPLNFVNNFSEVSNEMIDEMNVELNKGDINEAKTIASDIKQNLEKINHHGKRADAIVKGMLQHSRSSNGIKEPTNINTLADEYLKLAYHGLRAKDKNFYAAMKTDFDESIGNINIIPQDIGRVILNLISNAFYAAAQSFQGGLSDPDNGKVPVVWLCTKKENNKILISIKDNGPGIPSTILGKIFQPFFTTKPTGQGTGLGLSLAYDIVTKGHGGEIKVNTKENEGTEFTIVLPA